MLQDSNGRGLQNSILSPVCQQDSTKSLVQALGVDNHLKSRFSKKNGTVVRTFEVLIGGRATSALCYM